MSETIKIDQGIITIFEAVADVVSLPMAYENSSYVPVPQTAYGELLILPNISDAMDFSDTDEQTGVIRLILRYPENTGGFAIKTMADVFLGFMGIGHLMAHAGQETRITRNGRGPGVQEDGWYKIICDFYYVAYTPR